MLAVGRERDVESGDSAGVQRDGAEGLHTVEEGDGAGGRPAGEVMVAVRTVEFEMRAGLTELVRVAVEEKFWTFSLTTGEVAAW